MTDRDFSAVTELPEQPATREQIARLYQRYHWAAARAAGKRVLEAACGAGQGLGLLARSATRSVGGDYTLSLVQRARSHYGARVPVLCLDAEMLPFASGSFDVVLLFEAIYYLSDPARFLFECRRVLAPKGQVLLCTVNREWDEFSPSALSTRYYAASELARMLREAGFEKAEFFGGFPTAGRSLTARAVAGVRRAAAALHLIPRTLAGRERLKRIFYGRHEPLGPEAHDRMAPFEPLAPIAADRSVCEFKILYAAASGELPSL